MEWALLVNSGLSGVELHIVVVDLSPKAWI